MSYGRIPPVIAEPNPAAPDSLAEPCPWDDLDAEGSRLAVGDFLTVTVNMAMNALRRHITAPYAKQFGLTMAEWRILSVLAHARELPFADLVVHAATDKGQLSRTLRVMEDRGLLTTRTEGMVPHRKVTCLIAPAGRALYDQVMPVAQRMQAQMIRQMSAAERRAVYGALRRLQALCGGETEPDAE
jgi:DNA-binding MarR family transcriptional regulator